jgi:hypothetical protein
MPNTGERGEITSRVNAKEAETVQDSKKLAAKTKQRSEIARTKDLERRSHEPDGPPSTRKATRRPR